MDGLEFESTRQYYLKLIKKKKKELEREPCKFPYRQGDSATRQWTQPRLRSSWGLVAVIDDSLRVIDELHHLVGVYLKKSIYVRGVRKKVQGSKLGTQGVKLQCNMLNVFQNKCEVMGIV